MHTPRHVAPEKVHGALQLPSGKRRRQVQYSLILLIVAAATIVLGGTIALIIEFG